MRCAVFRQAETEEINGEPAGTPSTVMMRLWKHAPDHRTLPDSNDTMAAVAVLLRQAQHDGTSNPED